MASSLPSSSKIVPESNVTRSLNGGGCISEEEGWGLPDCCTYTSHGVVCRDSNLVRVSQAERVMDTEEDTAKPYKYDEKQKTKSKNRRKEKAESSGRCGRGRRGGRGTHQDRSAYIVASFHDEIGPDLRSRNPLVAVNSPGDSSTHGKHKEKKKKKKKKEKKEEAEEENSGRGGRGQRGTYQNSKAYMLPCFDDEIGAVLCIGNTSVAVNSLDGRNTDGKHNYKNKRIV